MAHLEVPSSDNGIFGTGLTIKAADISKSLIRRLLCRPSGLFFRRADARTQHLQLYLPYLVQ